MKETLHFANASANQNAVTALGGQGTRVVTNNRPQAAAQRQLQTHIQTSPRLEGAGIVQRVVDGSLPNGCLVKVISPRHNYFGQVGKTVRKSSEWTNSYEVVFEDGRTELCRFTELDKHAPPVAVRPLRASGHIYQSAPRDEDYTDDERDEIYSAHEEFAAQRAVFKGDQEQQDLQIALVQAMGNTPPYLTSEAIKKVVAGERRGRPKLHLHTQLDAAAYNQARLVEQNTGDNKLMIGPKTAIDRFIKSRTKPKGIYKARRLNLRGWNYKKATNPSFMQGGFDARARFRLVTDDNLSYLFTKALRNGNHFLGRLKKNHGNGKAKNESLYVRSSKQGKAHPSIFGIELAQAVENKYQYFRKPSGSQYLIPPPPKPQRKRTRDLR